MEINGKVVRIMPLVEGEGKNGPWKKLEFIIETVGTQYPKKVCFSLWGDRIDKSSLNEGEDLTVHFDLESREYNNRWYTEAKAWKVDKTGTATAVAPPAGIDQAPVDDSDLPF